MQKLNRELFAVDPTGRKLPNNGVTALDRPEDERALEVLEYELDSFVSTGEYAEGLRRILNSYVTNLDQGVQPAVWVSGFYGSGKSHFLRVLSYLWENPEVGGVAARSRVDPPAEVGELLTEIDAYGKRTRAPRFAAAGILRREGEPSIAEPILKIILGAAGLPEKYAPASFVLWLKEEPDRFERFMKALESRGRGLRDLERNLFVSREVRAALLEVEPGFAPSLEAAGQILAAEYRVDTISDGMVLDTIERVLGMVARESGDGTKATTPLTLLVLDELQQFIADDVQLLLQVQDMVERLTRRFEGRLLVVAAGQSALSANDMLARFTDRFTVQVQLESKDVETVVREVVLRKKPEEVPALATAMSEVSGEISRHLAGSKLAARADDKDDIVPDYPLLPTRRRFMENVLRAIDRGAAGQVRSQLRVTLEAVADVAVEPVGNVVSADVIYRRKKNDMVNQGVLLGELESRIAAVRDGTPEGELRARAVELVFLISHLDESAGIRPNVDTLADLLVTDLNEGSASLRQSLPGLLAELEGSLLVLDGGEYRLQSHEDAEWEQLFRTERARVMGDLNEQVESRTDALRRAVRTALEPLRITQGETRTSRKHRLHFGIDAPESDETSLVVWVRTGWEVSYSAVLTYAKELGIESSLVQVWLPKQSDQQFKEQIAAERAASAVLANRPPPTTETGQRARDAMGGRAKRAQHEIDRLAQDVLAQAAVVLGGGQQATTDQPGLLPQVRAALESAVVRKFSEFLKSDTPGWDNVLKRARAGRSDALEAVGYSGEITSHPVVSRVLAALGTEGRKGLEIVREFQAEPYGWSKDTIHGALSVLVLDEHGEAREGASVVQVADLTATRVGRLTFRKQTVVLTFAQKQRLKQLATRLLGVSPETAEQGVSDSLNALLRLAKDAGGDAPRPEPPDVSQIKKLREKFGVERQVAVADQVPALLELAERWKVMADQITGRMAEWDQAQVLLSRATGLPSHAEREAALGAIRKQRSLLSDPDPVRPELKKLEADLRAAVDDAYQAEHQVWEETVAGLASRPEWEKLPEGERAEFLSRQGLGEPVKPALGTRAELLDSLSRESLAVRRDRAMLYPGRMQQAAEALVKRFLPEAKKVRPQPATLATRAEAEEYLTRLRAEIMGHIDAGATVSVEG